MISARTRRFGWRPWALLAPALVVFVLFLAVPMALMLLMSVQEFDLGTGRSGGLTLGHYERVVGDSYYWWIMLRTLKLSLATTAICLLIGYPVAYHFYTATPRRRSLLALIFISPLMISAVIRTYGWVIVLGSNGLVNETLRAFGVVQEPLRILFTEGAVIVGLTHVLLPFMILAIISALEMVDPVLPLQAENLGASAWSAFWRVTVPLSLPGVISGSLIVFTLSTSVFITPAVLGGAKVKVFSYLIYEQVVNILNWPFGAALVYVLLLVSVALVALTMRLGRRPAQAPAVR